MGSFQKLRAVAGSDNARDLSVRIAEADLPLVVLLFCSETCRFMARVLNSSLRLKSSPLAAPGPANSVSC